MPDPLAAFSPLPDSEVGLVGSGPHPAAWVRWIADHALQGRPAEALVARLVQGGVAVSVAQPAVAAVLASPIFAAGAAVAARASALQQSARLVREMDPAPIPVRTSIDPDTLYREHWTANRPCVLRGAASAWPAAGWTFAGLQARFRWSPVDVSVREPGWSRSPRVTRRMAFGDLVDVCVGPPSDSLYADGNCELLNQAGLVPLRAELGTLPGLVGDGTPRAWLGPAGTVTPTHHDQSTAWQVLLVGHKRVQLASPLDASLASTADGFFNHADPQDVDLGGVRWHEVDLMPGDALFAPVGWWHRVEAMEPSISVSMSGFAWPNAYPWYRPGH